MSMNNKLINFFFFLYYEIFFPNVSNYVKIIFKNVTLFNKFNKSKISKLRK